MTRPQFNVFRDQRASQPERISKDDVDDHSFYSLNHVEQVVKEISWARLRNLQPQTVCLNRNGEIKPIVDHIRRKEDKENDARDICMTANRVKELDEMQDVRRNVKMKRYQGVVKNGPISKQIREYCEITKPRPIQLVRRVKKDGADMLGRYSKNERDARERNDGEGNDGEENDGEENDGEGNNGGRNTGEKCAREIQNTSQIDTVSEGSKIINESNILPDSFSNPFQAFAKESIVSDQENEPKLRESSPQTPGTSTHQAAESSNHELSDTELRNRQLHGKLPHGKQPHDSTDNVLRSKPPLKSKKRSRYMPRRRQLKSPQLSNVVKSNHYPSIWIYTKPKRISMLELEQHYGHLEDDLCLIRQ